MRGCVVNGCLELAKWVPCVKVKLPCNDHPFKLDFENLCICNTHKERFTLNDIVTDKRLTQLQNLFIMSNLTKPNREHMELTWLLDSFSTLLPIFDTNGKQLGVTQVINKDLSKKIG